MFFLQRVSQARLPIPFRQSFIKKKTYHHLLPRQFSTKTSLIPSRVFWNKIPLPFKAAVGTSLLGVAYFSLSSVAQESHLDPCIQDLINQGEKACALALQQAKQPRQQLYPIIALGDVTLQRAVKQQDKQALIQAAGLYNYALHISPAGTDSRSVLLKKLTRVEEELLLLCNGSAASFSFLKWVYGQSPENFTANRSQIKKRRKEMEQLVHNLPSEATPKEVREVCRTISTSIKRFATELVEQCIQQLGPPPCSYAIIGLGSLAREEITPHSDLECAILLEDEQYRPYFRNLSYLLHFKVVNLGETILPCLNISNLREAGFYDGRTPRGFSFDGEGGGVNALGIATKGCKTPFGNRNTFHLIHTPEQMAAFQGMDLEGLYWVEKEPHLPMELIAHTLIMGSPQLAKEYRTVLDTQLAKPYKQGTMCSYLAKHHLYHEDSDHFDPRLSNAEKEGQLFEVKNDLYRLPHLLIDRLACFFELSSLNTLDRVDELQKRGIFSQQAAINVKELVAATTKLRLQTYQFHQKQKGTMNAIADQFGFTQQEGQFVAGEENLHQLEKVYQILLPFRKGVQEFFHGERETFETAIFCDNTPFVLGEIATRLLQYQKAKVYYLQAQQQEGSSAKVLSALGLVSERLGEKEKAVDYLERALKKAQRTDHDKPLEYAVHLSNLALAYQEAGRWEAAVPLFEKARGIVEMKLGKENLAFAKVLNNQGLAYLKGNKLGCALKCFEEAMEIAKARNKGQSLIVANYLNNLAYAYQEKDDLARALPLFEEALEIARAMYGEVHPIFVKYLNNVAHAYRENGDLDRALPFFEKSVQMARVIYGQKHPTLAIHLRSLASACQEKGQIKRMLSLFKEALIITKGAYEEHHPEVVISQNNLANAYMEAGDLSNALPLLKQVLPVTKKIFGGDHPDVAISLLNLASAYQERGELKRALPLFEQALEIAKKAYGHKHSKLAIFMNNLATAYQEAGQLGRALPLFEQAREKIQETYGDQHPKFATASNNLGRAYKIAGKWQDVLDLFNEALRIDKAYYGNKHPKVAVDLNNLATVHEENGQLECAVDLFEQALEVTKEAYGDEHPTVARMLSNLAMACLKQKQMDRALSLIEQALDIDKAKYGEQHPVVARDLSNLAGVYQESGQWERAISLFRRVLEIDKAAYGEEHPKVAVTLNNLGCAYKEEGRLKCARSELEKGLKIIRKASKRKHRYEALVLGNLAEVYQKAGEWNRAVPLLKQALEVDREVYGTFHPIVARRLNDLALAYKKLGQLDYALPLFQEAVKITENFFGKDHRNTKTARYNLAACTKALKRYAK